MGGCTFSQRCKSASTCLREMGKVASFISVKLFVGDGLRARAISIITVYFIQIVVHLFAMEPFFFVRLISSFLPVSIPPFVKNLSIFPPSNINWFLV